MDTGYSILDIFQSLTPFVDTPEDLRNQIISNLPNGVTTTDVVDLFGDYGY